MTQMKVQMKMMLNHLQIPKMPRRVLILLNQITSILLQMIIKHKNLLMTLHRVMALLIQITQTIFPQMTLLKVMIQLNNLQTLKMTHPRLTNLQIKTAQILILLVIHLQILLTTAMMLNQIYLTPLGVMSNKMMQILQPQRTPPPTLLRHVRKLSQLKSTLLLKLR